MLSLKPLERAGFSLLTRTSPSLFVCLFVQVFLAHDGDVPALSYAQDGSVVLHVCILMDDQDGIRTRVSKRESA